MVQHNTVLSGNVPKSGQYPMYSQAAIQKRRPLGLLVAQESGLGRGSLTQAVGFLAQKFQLLDAWGLMSGAECLG